VTQRIIGVAELQRRFPALFDGVAKGNTPFVLTRGSRPEVAMISYEEYQRYQAFQEQEILAHFDFPHPRKIPGAAALKSPKSPS